MQNEPEPPKDEEPKADGVTPEDAGPANTPDSRRSFLGKIAAAAAVVGVAGAAGATPDLPLKSRILARIKGEVEREKADGEFSLTNMKDYYKADYSKGGGTTYSKDGYVKGDPDPAYVKGGTLYTKIDYAKTIAYAKAIPTYAKSVPIG